MTAIAETQVRRHRRPSIHGDRIGAWLLGLCAVGATLAAVAAATDVRAADPAAMGVEAWRMIGYVMFAGVFVLLARSPRRMRGLFELTIAAKLALPVAALTIVRDADEAITFLVADGVVVVLLVVAYSATKAWRAPW